MKARIGRAVRRASVVVTVHRAGARVRGLDRTESSRVDAAAQNAAGTLGSLRYRAAAFALPLLLICALGAVGCTYGESTGGRAPVSIRRFRVEGLPRRGELLCMGCAQRVERALSSVPGVHHVDFDSEDEIFDARCDSRFESRAAGRAIRQEGVRHDTEVGLEGSPSWLLIEVGERLDGPD